jgi:hypothetical protein
LHDGDVADSLASKFCLRDADDDRDPPRSLERRITISCHAPLSA